MTERERFISALERKPIKGLVPHFELVFFLTMEKFGKVHPIHRQYSQWNQMSEKERNLHRNDIADLYIQTAEEYNHSAIFIHENPNEVRELIKTVNLIRDKTGDKYFLTAHGDGTYAIPNGDELVDFTYRLADEPEKLKSDAEKAIDDMIKRAELIKKECSLDGFTMCSDYCFNSGPFLSPGMMEEFIIPYLARQTKAYRDMGFHTIKHTDGNIMPILDMLAETKPHALHSIDPQGGVDIKEVKRLVGDKITLIGNVNCGLLQTGTEEEAIESIRYSLENGMPGGGYIFSTSNCVYTGLQLERYEMMIDIWKKEGIYNKI